MRTLSFFGIAALALNGCAIAPNPAGESFPSHPPMTYDIRLDSSTTPEQAELAMAALGDWEKAVPGLALNIQVSDMDCPNQPTGQYAVVGCIHILFTPLAYVHTDSGNDTFAGVTFSNGFGASNIELPSNPESVVGLVDRMPQVIRHELGHSFSLSHVLDKSELMYPTSEGSANISCGDITQFAQVHGLALPSCIELGTNRFLPDYNSYGAGS
jgi:hypothetical protein